jgi:hypothetical protein
MHSRLGMIPRDYEAFTVAADFARLRAGRIYMNDRAFDEFINGNDFKQILGDDKPQYSYVICDLDACVAGNGNKEDNGKRKMYYIAKIDGRTTVEGCHFHNLKSQTDDDGKLIQTPPKISGLRSKQREFVRTIMPSIDRLYNFFLADDDLQTERNNSNNKHTNTIVLPQPLKKSKSLCLSISLIL